MKNVSVKSMCLLLATIGLSLSITASFFFVEKVMVVADVGGGTRAQSHLEYPLVLASLGFAIFAGASTLGAAIVQAAEIRARGTENGGGGPTQA